MAAVLLALVIVNAACTGYLVAQVRAMKRTVGKLGEVVRDVAGGHDGE